MAQFSPTTPSGVLFEGSLVKKGQLKGTGWRPRFFRLTCQGLLYFADEKSSKSGKNSPRNRVDLNDITALSFEQSNGASQSAVKHGDFKITVICAELTWIMRTPSESVFHIWKHAMETKLPSLFPLREGEVIVHRGLARLCMFEIASDEPLADWNPMYAVLTDTRIIWYWNETVAMLPEGAYAQVSLSYVHKYESHPVYKGRENVFKLQTRFAKWKMSTGPAAEVFREWERLIRERVPEPGSLGQFEARRTDGEQQDLQQKVSARSAMFVRAMWYPSLVGNLVMHKINPDKIRWWDRVDDYLLLGALPFESDMARLTETGLRAVVTLNEDWELRGKGVVTPQDWRDAGIDHLHLPTLDFFCAPSLGDISKGVQFIKDHVDRMELTLVHCKAGRGRSATLVLCYLITHRGMSATEALEYVKRSREQVELGHAQWETVLRFAGETSAPSPS